MGEVDDAAVLRAGSAGLHDGGSVAGAGTGGQCGRTRRARAALGSCQAGQSSLSRAGRRAGRGRARSDSLAPARCASGEAGGDRGRSRRCAGGQPRHRQDRPRIRRTGVPGCEGRHLRGVLPALCRRRPQQLPGGHLRRGARHRRLGLGRQARQGLGLEPPAAGAGAALRSGGRFRCIYRDGTHRHAGRTRRAAGEA